MKNRLIPVALSFAVGPAFGQVIYQTSFDDSSGWSFDGLGGVAWRVDALPSSIGGNPQCASPDPPSYLSAPFSLNFNNDVDIQRGPWAEGTADSPPIDLCGTHAPMLRLWSAWCVEPGCGFDVRKLVVKRGSTTLLSVCMDTVEPAPATWELLEFPLDPTWGVVQVRFWCDTVDESFNEGSGWFIDDLAVVETATGVQNYCISAPNSSSATGAVMGSSGSTSITTNDFTIHATCCPTGQLSLFLCSQSSAQFPAGDGFFCVGTPFYRLYPASPTGVTGAPTYELDLVDPPPTVTVPVVAGSTWRFQNWYRDPGVGLFGYNFSDGVEVTFAP